MKFGVVVFPGSNCDHDAFNVLKHVFNQEVEFLWHKESDLKGSDFIILPGGFSYGDYLRSGAIARFSPIMEKVIEHANNGGYVLGICNGFQVLCESHLLPGALLRNANQKFICRNVHIKCVNHDTLLTRNIPAGEILTIPVAHAEGRYFADENLLSELNDNNQILFTYCNSLGNQTEKSNINGSVSHIAGICNKERNVFGMMPHPERASEDVLGNTDGAFLFESILNLKHS